jgi:hypothetical protein
MCTDELLTRLRCADCRHAQFAQFAQFEQFYDVSFVTLLIAVTEALTWMLWRRPQDCD